jgi:hypothetical protein
LRALFDSAFNRCDSENEDESGGQPDGPSKMTHARFLVATSVAATLAFLFFPSGSAPVASRTSAWAVI